MPTPIIVFLYIFSAVIILTAVFLITGKIIKYKHTRCPNCKYKYNYQKDVLPQVKERFEKNGKIKYRVEYECFCRRCGKERSYFSVVRSKAKK